jgi:hypothetical protein
LNKYCQTNKIEFSSVMWGWLAVVAVVTRIKIALTNSGKSAIMIMEVIN